jgi:putative transposase
VAHVVSLPLRSIVEDMILTSYYRALPTMRQHRALELILEGQRQLYNAALQERIEAYQKAKITRSYMDQSKALTVWRQSDPDAAAFPVNLQRWTLKRLDDAYQGFFRRIKKGGKPGFPRFRGKARFNTFGFREFSGIGFNNGRITFKGLPGRLRVHVHRPLRESASIRSCFFRRTVKGWIVGLAIEVPPPPMRVGSRVIGIDLGISTFAVLSDGGFFRA